MAGTSQLLSDVLGAYKNTSTGPGTSADLVADRLQCNTFGVNSGFMIILGYSREFAASGLALSKRWKFWFLAVCHFYYVVWELLVGLIAARNRGLPTFGVGVAAGDAAPKLGAAAVAPASPPLTACVACMPAHWCSVAAPRRALLATLRERSIQFVRHLARLPLPLSLSGTLSITYDGREQAFRIVSPCEPNPYSSIFRWLPQSADN